MVKIKFFSISVRNPKVECIILSSNSKLLVFCCKNPVGDFPLCFGYGRTRLINSRTWGGCLFFGWNLDVQTRKHLKFTKHPTFDVFWDDPPRTGKGEVGLFLGTKFYRDSAMALRTCRFPVPAVSEWYRIQIIETTNVWSFFWCASQYFWSKSGQFRPV